jgi:DNA end-binding protein Ku
VPPRPYWKGYLKLSLVLCPIALTPATSATEKVSFRQVNKQTGIRIRYRKVDSETDEEVTSDQIGKGYGRAEPVQLVGDDRLLQRAEQPRAAEHRVRRRNDTDHLRRAERVGFEPTVDLRLRQFSRLVP